MKTYFFQNLKSPLTLSSELTEMQILIILNRRLTFLLDGSQYEAPIGSIILIPASNTLTLKAEDKHSSFYLLKFSILEIPAKLNIKNLTRLENISTLILSAYDFTYVKLLFRLLHSRLTYGKVHEPFTIGASYLLASIISDLDWLMKKTVLQNLNPEYEIHPVLTAFINLLNLEHHRNRSVSFYASELFMSASNLRKIMKKETGESPRKFIDRYILYKAKILLSADYSIQYISDELGFSDISSFSRFFKKNQGLSPAAFRNMIKKKT